MITPRFTGKVVNGKVYLDDQEMYDLWLSSLEDKRIELVVQKEKSIRTIQQNKYLWAVVYQTISDQLGYTTEEIHNLMKSILLKTHLDAGSKRYTVVKSTAQLSTEEFSKYIEDIKNWSATEFGLVIPEAGKFNL